MFASFRYLLRSHSHFKVAAGGRVTGEAAHKQIAQRLRPLLNALQSTRWWLTRHDSPIGVVPVSAAEHVMQVGVRFDEWKARLLTDIERKQAEQVEVESQAAAVAAREAKRARPVKRPKRYIDEDGDV